MAVNFIAGPFKVYTAAVNTGVPKYEGTDPQGWTVLGSDSQDDSGIVVNQTHTYNDQRVQNEMLPLEAFRATIDITVAVTLKNFDGPTLAIACGVTKTSTATGKPFASGVTGDQVGLEGPTPPHTVTKLAVFAAGNKAVGSAKHAAMYLPNAYVSSNWETSLLMAEGGGIPVTFTALKSDTHVPAFFIQT